MLVMVVVEAETQKGEWFVAVESVPRRARAGQAIVKRNFKLLRTNVSNKLFKIECFPPETSGTSIKRLTLDFFPAKLPPSFVSFHVFQNEFPKYNPGEFLPGPIWKSPFHMTSHRCQKVIYTEKQGPVTRERTYLDENRRNVNFFRIRKKHP